MFANQCKYILFKRNIILFIYKNIKYDQNITIHLQKKKKKINIHFYVYIYFLLDGLRGRHCIHQLFFDQFKKGY